MKTNRIVLDTSAVREIGDPKGNDAILRGLQALHRQRHTIHLADGTMVELTAQLAEARLAWAQWIRARGALARLVDDREPILPGGAELLAEAGMTLDGKVVARTPLAERRAGWKRLVKAKNASELWKPRPMKLDGRRVLGNTDPQSARIARADQKDDWVDGFERIARTALTTNEGDLTKAQFDVLVADTLRAFDGKISSPVDPAPSVRLDALVRVYLLLAVRRLQTKGAYNASKRSNDAFDHDLLRYLAVPNLIATCDTSTLVAAVKESGAWQLRWILSPRELEDVASGAAAPSLAWPT